jgi:hypothetical protein
MASGDRLVMAAYAILRWPECDAGPELVPERESRGLLAWRNVY